MAWLIEREYGDAMVFAAMVGLAGIVGYVLLERHGRARWRLIPLRELRVDIPYRNVSAIAEYRVHAPLSVRVAAIASMALSTTGVATLFVAIPRLHFEGLAVSLVAAALMAVFCGGCGVATVAPSKTQLEMMRLATVGSVFLYAGLLFMSVFHGFSNGAAQISSPCEWRSSSRDAASCTPRSSLRWFALTGAPSTSRADRAIQMHSALVGRSHRLAG